MDIVVVLDLFYLFYYTTSSWSCAASVMLCLYIISAPAISRKGAWKSYSTRDVFT